MISALGPSLSIGLPTPGVVRAAAPLDRVELGNSTPPAMPANSYACDGVRGGGPLDVPALKGCGVFTMRLSKPSAEDAMVAAGVAMASGRRSVYLVDDVKELPWFLREADRALPGQVTIASVPPARLDTTPRPLPEVSGPPLETFIGCLMSGLSEAQYQEGHAHLQAIDAALGTGANYCEGLLVKSTSTFDAPADSLRLDLDAIRRSKRCVFYLFDGKPRPSGIWVEAGVALALDKPCTFLVPDRKALPPCLQNPPGNVRVIEYGNHGSLLAGLKESPARWL
ncbi:MAG: hypothetical protein FJX76_14960 [Armatimonadetes bacterium]|nr:hypothetical protein [Armatimonadota bacterium]